MSGGAGSGLVSCNQFIIFILFVIRISEEVIQHWNYYRSAALVSSGFGFTRISGRFPQGIERAILTDVNIFAPLLNLN
jgi:hypothetical protein